MLRMPWLECHQKCASCVAGDETYSYKIGLVRAKLKAEASGVWPPVPGEHESVNSATLTITWPSMRRFV